MKMNNPGTRSRVNNNSEQCIYSGGIGHARARARVVQTRTPFNRFSFCVLSDQLYFAVLQQKIKSTSERHSFCVDDELVYEK